jgi:hypothetical protein
MKTLLNTQRLLVILSLLFIVSCSKKDEAVTPSTSTLTGKWNHKATTGKLTYTSSGQTKTFDLTDGADGSTIEFKADGTVIYEGNQVKYTLTGTSMVLNYGAGLPTIDFTISKFTATEMALSFTKDQFIKYMERYYDTNDATTRDIIKNKATATLPDYTVSYTK